MRHHRIRAEPAEPSARWSALEDSSVVATLLVAAGGEILSANAKMRELLGAPSARAIGAMNVRDLLVDPADWQAWEAVLATGGGRTVTSRLRRPAGELVLRGDLRRVDGEQARDGHCALGIFTDVTREQQLARAVQQSARLEALGSLTAGVAHDFNNLLTILVGNLSLVAEEVRGQEKLFGKIKPARDAAKRGSELIRQLLAFARREDAAVGVVDAGKVATGLEPLLKRALGVRVAFECVVDPGVWPVRASTAQLESVIVNLAVNARDAIEGKGKVTVRVGEDAARRADGQPGGSAAPREVGISVADDGCGIPPQLLERVFEPFFSTKTERGGTGLGLSMVRWFAEEAGGSVGIDSEVGRGTTVTLRLPLCGEASDTIAGTSPLSTLPAGKERVLVVAAEEEMRSTIQQILEVLGYTVRAAAEVASVQPLLATFSAELLIVDGQLCAGGAGSQWLAAVREERPGIKLIVATDAGTQSAAPVGTAALSKPFSLADLAKTVRRTLDRDGADGNRPQPLPY